MRVRVLIVVVAAVLGTLLASPPAGAKGGPGATAPPGSDPFATVNESMRARVRADGLEGGMVLVVRDGSILDQQHYGDLGGDTAIPIASASKWLTSATLMTLVDEGRLSLDDSVSDHLPGFGGAKKAVKVRHLLSHTSGLEYDGCIADTGTTTEACTARIADGADPSARPGTRFEYSSVGYEVAARIVEVLTGQSFEDAFEARIARPLGMTATRFDTFGGERIRHPQPAASAVSTVDDYAEFVAMMANGGTVGDRRILAADSVAEIEKDQVAGIDTRDDGAVQTTGIPTYGLGVWRDVVGPDDQIKVVSGSGAYGFYPWIDHRHASYGIIAVADLSHGAEHAVPASQRQARASWRAAAKWVP
ncbi:MAG: serine hydrolase domain-containing protein [Acidimicrobiia bacterium]